MRSIAAAFAVIAASPALLAENMVFNPGFELGDSGYSFAKYLRPDKNPQLKFEKPIIDAATFESGKQSLRIPNSFAEQGKIAVGDFKLELGKEYTFSFAAKAESSNCVISATLASVGPGDWNWDPKNRKFEIGPEWKTYEFSFKSKDGWPQPVYSLWLEFCHSKDPKPGSIWLDSLRLEQTLSAKNGSALAGAELEACSRFEKRVLLIPGGASSVQASIVTHVVNNSAKKTKAELTLNLVEDFSGSLKTPVDGASRELAKINVELAPFEAKSVETKADLSKAGAFRLDTAVKSGAKAASRPDFCVCAWKLERRLVDLDNEFCSGVNFGGGGLKMPPNYGELDLPGYNMSMDHDDLLDMYAELGIRLFRDWDYGHPAFDWKEIEPEQGKMDFSFADKTVDDAAKRGIRVLPVIGTGFIVDKKTGASGWPLWLDAQCRAEEKCGDWGKDVKIPPTELWRKHVRAIAVHFKGRLSHYEIVNEPNGYLRPAVYLELLKAAYEEIKAADPEAKVVGFCSTGDMGGNLAGFLDECFSKGGLDYADIVSFHPYAAPALGSATPADRQIDGIKALLAKANAKDKPLWNTELYYLTKASSDKGLCQPHDIAQRFLTDLGEGLKQSATINSNDAFRSMTPRFPYSYAKTYEIPAGTFSIYNALAKFFQGASPAAKFKWGNDTVCYVYERDGKCRAAFWSYGEMQGLKLKLPGGEGSLQLYDLFGNKEPLGAAPLTLGPAPFYLDPKEGIGKDAFLALLKSAQVEASTPVEVGSARLVPSEGGWTALLTLRNACGAELKGNLGVNGNGVVGAAIVDISIPAGGEKPFAVPVKLETSGPSEITVKLHTGGKTWEFPAKLGAPAKTYPARKDGAQAIERLKSGNASFSASYDDKFLRIAFDVKDALPSGEARGRDPWEQDCVEIFIDAALMELPLKYADLHTDKMPRLFILPYAQEGERLVVWARGLEKLTRQSAALKIELRDGGYSGTLDIPLEALQLAAPLKGKCIGFEFAVDYSDAEKRQSSESWSSDGKAYKSRLSFGFITFA